MNKQISTLLEIDEVEFENLQTERYLRWCISVANRQCVPLQAVIANQSINNYYNYHFSKLQQNFLKLVNGKTKFLDKKALNEFYEIIIVDVFKNYPNALLEEAKKIKIENPPYANN